MMLHTRVPTFPASQKPTYGSMKRKEPVKAPKPEVSRPGMSK